MCSLCVQKEMENLQDAEEELLMLEGDDECVPYPFMISDCIGDGDDEDS